MVDTRFYVSHGPLALSELLKGLPIEAGFDDSVLINTVSALNNGSKGSLTYYENRRYRTDIAESQATACFVKPDDLNLLQDTPMIALVTDFPRASFAHCIGRLQTSIDIENDQVFVSPKATIGPRCHIAPGAVIAQNAVIGENCRIGASVYIGPGVVIGNHVTIASNVAIECAIIGNNVRIFSGTSIGQAGFGIASDETGAVDVPHIGRVIIHDNVSLGSQCAIDRGMLGDTVIGAGSKFDNFCQIAHNVQIGKNCMIAAHAGISGSCILEDNVVMGGRVGLADHLHIGEGAQLAANAGVMKNVPAGEIWSGYPAKPLRMHMKEVAAIARMIKKKPKP